MRTLSPRNQHQGEWLRRRLASLLLLPLGLALGLGQAPGAGPARAAVPDSPVNIAVASDGHVWLVMSTDDGTIGIDRYTANLGFVRGFQSLGGVHDIAADLDGGVYFDQELPSEDLAEVALGLVSQVDDKGDHRAIWDLKLQGNEFIRALAVDAEGQVDVLVIGDAGAGQIRRFAPGGGPGGEPVAILDVEAWGLEIAIAQGGTRYIAYNDPDRPHVVRYDAEGQVLGEWDLPAVPMGLDVGPDGKVYVTTRTQAKDSRVERFLADGRADGGFKVAGIGVRIAVGPEGSIYVNVETPPFFNWEIRRYSPSGAVRASIPWDQMQRRRSANPPTVTPQARPSATIGPSPSATLGQPSRTPSPSPTVTTTGPRVSPSPSATEGEAPTHRLVLPLLGREYDRSLPPAEGLTPPGPARIRPASPSPH